MQTDMGFQNRISKQDWLFSSTSDTIKVGFERLSGEMLKVETFLEKGRFIGTCYKAAGWNVLGETKGYDRNAKKYYYHECCNHQTHVLPNVYY